MSVAVFCTAKSVELADFIVTQLERGGFPRDDISVLVSDQRSTRDLATTKSSKMPEGAAAGGVTGGLLAGTLGLLAGIGALAIPGIGPIIAAGPVMAALSAAAVGGAAGGVIGGLVGLGMPEYEAKRYAGHVTAGNVLISVHVAGDDQKTLAEQVCERAGGDNISAVTETRVEKGS